MPEKGKEGKFSVARNDNLRGKNETSLRSFLTVQLCCNQPVWPCITNKSAAMLLSACVAEGLSGHA